MPESNQGDSLFKQILPFTASKGDLRKMEIVKAAIKCIHEHGFEHTNYETIGKIAGMKRPHVAYHFPDKTVLIKTAVRYVYAIGQETVVDFIKPAKETWDAQIAAYVEGTLAWISKNKEFGAVIVLTMYLSSVDDGYRKFSTEVKDIGRQRVRAMLAKNDQINSKHLDELSQTIHTYIVGRCVHWMTCEPHQNLDAFIKESISSIRKLVNRTKV